MKKRSKYNPNKHARNPNAAFDAINLSQPVKQDAKDRLDIAIRTALLAFTNGAAIKSHFNTLASTVDLCSMASKTMFENAYEAEIDAGREAMIRCRERFAHTQKLGLDGEGISAIKQVIEIHNELLNNVTGAEVLKFLKVRDQHIKSGNFYKGNGEARLAA